MGGTPGGGGGGATSRGNYPNELSVGEVYRGGGGILGGGGGPGAPPWIRL